MNIKKELLSVRIPPELMGEIDGLAAKTKRDKTSVTIDLLTRGLGTLSESPIKTANFATIEDLAALRNELEEVKKL